MQRKNIIIGNLNIRYYRSAQLNKDNMLVFLHGWGSQATHFQKTLERCQSFVAIDLPGFGDSEAPYSAWSLDDYANFVRAFLKKLGIENPILAGHSFGGSVSIKYCALGNAAKKLILIGSAGIRKKNTRKYIYLIIAKIFKLFFYLPGAQAIKNIARRRFYRSIGSEDYIDAGAMTKTYLNIISTDLTDDLQKIVVPTALIWGEQDTDTPIQDGRLMHHLIKNSQLHVIPNAGHYVFLDNQNAFGKIFLDII